MCRQLFDYLGRLSDHFLAFWWRSNVGCISDGVHSSPSQRMRYFFAILDIANRYQYAMPCVIYE